MRWLAAISLLLVTGLCFGQEYSDQDRFGKTNVEIAAMGHPKWIEWYCQDGRMGKDGRIQGEKIYAIALYHRNKKAAESRSEAEKKFLEDVWILYANLAKSALTLGHAAYRENPAVSLFAATSGTSINVAIGDLLQSSAPPQPIQFKDLQRELDLSKSQLQTAPGRQEPYIGNEFPRLVGMVERLEKFFESRSDREKRISRRFCLEMIRGVNAGRPAKPSRAL